MKPLLDRLPHRIDVERLRAGCLGRPAASGSGRRAEQFQRLGLGRRGEGDIGDAGRRWPGPPSARPACLRCRPRRRPPAPPSRRPTAPLQLRRRLAGLRAECASSAMTAKRLPWVAASSCTAFEREGKGLDGADDDLLARRQRLGQLAALAAAFALDRGHDALRALERRRSLPATAPSITLRSETTSTVENSFLSLASCRSARKCAVQAMELVLPEPAECWIRYLPPAPSASTAADQLSGGVELVVAGEDELFDLLLLVLLGHEVAAEDFQPAVPRPDLLPEVGRSVARSGSAGCRPRRGRPC